MFKLIGAKVTGYWGSELIIDMVIPPAAFKFAELPLEPLYIFRVVKNGQLSPILGDSGRIKDVDLSTVDPDIILTITGY